MDPVTTPARRRGLVGAGAALAAAALLLTACSSSTPAEETTSSSAESSSATETSTVEPGSVKLGIAYWDTITVGFQLMAEGAQAVADADPAIDLIASAPNSGDPAKLLPLFQSMAQTQTDGVILQALAADPFYRPVLDTTEAGTPVIAIDAPPPADAGVDLWITNDNTALGTMLATELLKQIPADATGEIVVGTNGPSVPPLMARVDGMIATFQAERPGITIVGPISTYGTQGSPQENYSAWEGIYNQHPDAVAYVAPGAQDAVSLALVQERNDTHFLAGGMDLEPGSMDAVKNGYIAALVSPEHWLKGYIAAKILAAHAEEGAEIPAGTWDTGGIVVTSDNIDEIIDRQSSPENMLAALGPVGDAQIADPSSYLTN
ncbi:sugar ABC transporter substrate-binding protein [Actinotalea sp. M2MS4P-6]|uniref:sugar ABC transporter substrate-binding protein n=1 Tax=Actinotalea sp. M2MS4P-6 TaxID=2983762 RepID=UPI0021E4CF73|nr:sugar ABC transporter substrate-binding protein [Actinotalea sp. M2MS4P-6]MCV2393875.1 sugar ABC transporter substrate-binding protein [Actinotalea sp. M2MS4P-6]